MKVMQKKKFSKEWSNDVIRFRKMSSCRIKKKERDNISLNRINIKEKEEEKVNFEKDEEGMGMKRRYLRYQEIGLKEFKKREEKE